MVNEKICYVIMPFSKLGKITEKKWTETFEELFKPAIEDAGLEYKCIRSTIRNGSFTKDILKNLKNANVVLADVSGTNPNVMWELGVRHTFSRRTILVVRKDLSTEKIISDLKNYGVIDYVLNPLPKVNAFKKKIKELLEGIEQEPERDDSPVFDYLSDEELILSSYGRKQIINKLIGLMTENGENLELTNGILSKTITLGRESEGNVTNSRYNLKGLEKLLVENYVNGGEKYIKLLQSIRKKCNGTNHQLDISLTTSKEHREKLIDVIMEDSKELKKELTKLMNDSRDLYSAVKLNSLIDVEPNITISKELGKEFFK